MDFPELGEYRGDNHQQQAGMTMDADGRSTQLRANMGAGQAAMIVP
jgi:hypothetical protein